MIDENIKSQYNKDELSLKDLIKIIQDWYQYLYKKWKLIFLISFMGAIVGFIYAKSQPVKYKAILTFIVDEEKSNSSGLGNLASQFGFDAGSGGGAFSGANLVELMKTRLIIERTLLHPIVVNGETISIAEFYLRLNKMRESLKVEFLPNADRSKFSLEQDMILKSIYKSLSGSDNLSILQKDKKVSFQTIEVTNTDENFAKIFCENLAKVTTEYYIEIKSKKAKNNVEILQKQVDSIRNQFNISIVNVARETDNIYNINPAFKAKGVQPAKKQIDLQINTSMLSSLVTNLEMSKMALRKETPLIQIIDRPTYPLEKIKLSSLISLIIGGFLAGFLTILYLISIKLYKNVIS
jgi:uncharacterized protein involved in exopolysaccharide biosynthesis